MSDPSEKHESLWMLAAGPLVWGAHFLLCYGAVAVWCGKLAGPDRSLHGARVAIGLFTLIALLGIGVVAWIGYRRHGWLVDVRPHDFDTAQDRHKFMGFATLILAGLSAVATAYVALTAVYFGTCH